MNLINTVQKLLLQSLVIDQTDSGSKLSLIQSVLLQIEKYDRY